MNDSFNVRERPTEGGLHRRCSARQPKKGQGVGGETQEGSMPCSSSTKRNQKIRSTLGLIGHKLGVGNGRGQGTGGHKILRRKEDWHVGGQREGKLGKNSSSPESLSEHPLSGKKRITDKKGKKVDPYLYIKKKKGGENDR